MDRWTCNFRLFEEAHACCCLYSSNRQIPDRVWPHPVHKGSVFRKSLPSGNSTRHIWMYSITTAWQYHTNRAAGKASAFWSCCHGFVVQAWYTSSLTWKLTQYTSKLFTGNRQSQKKQNKQVLSRLKVTGATSGQMRSDVIRSLDRFKMILKALLKDRGGLEIRKWGLDFKFQTSHESVFYLSHLLGVIAR